MAIVVDQDSVEYVFVSWMDELIYMFSFLTLVMSTLLLRGMPRIFKLADLCFRGAFIVQLGNEILCARMLMFSFICVLTLGEAISV